MLVLVPGQTLRCRTSRARALCSGRPGALVASSRLLVKRDENDKFDTSVENEKEKKIFHAIFECFIPVAVLLFASLAKMGDANAGDVQN